MLRNLNRDRLGEKRVSISMPTNHTGISSLGLLQNKLHLPVQIYSLSRINALLFFMQAFDITLINAKDAIQTS
jgi:hypothetical protein